MGSQVALRTADRFAEYRVWLDQRWAEWRRINGLSQGAPVSYAQHQAFDAWLRFRSERLDLVDDASGRDLSRA